jgi:hypothetical protein
MALQKKNKKKKHHESSVSVGIISDLVTPDHPQ